VQVGRIVGIFKQDGELRCSVVQFAPTKEKCEGKPLVVMLVGTEVIVENSCIIKRVGVFTDREPRGPRDLPKESCSLVCTHAAVNITASAVTGLRLVPITDIPRFLFEGVDPAAPKRAERAVADKKVFHLLRLFFNYFYDDFSSWLKMQQSIGGGYLTFGNLPRHLRQLLGNIIPIHFGPMVHQKTRTQHQ
jgi:hypothetical protein